VESSTAQSIFEQIDAWYGRAPSGMSENERVRWVQYSSEIPCPACGEPLWVLRTRRAQNRGIYHLAMCQRPGCDFQIDD
jgi:predicted RNA-binding Zn-ribbon protein involved in translation (DUF1610 family)